MKSSRLFNNLVLLTVVVLVTFVVLEIFVEKFLITKTPLKFQFALPAGLAVLAQSSKSGRIPENYIAIAGDSYAQGKGDWLLETDSNTNNPFHSAHILQALTGRDVVSFGKSGASNIVGWVREPIVRYELIHDVFDDSLEHPEILLVYFYAGNDLLENVLQVRGSFVPEHGAAALGDVAAWEKYFRKSVSEKKKDSFDHSTGWFARAVVKVLANELKAKKSNTDLGDIRIKKTGLVNRVLVGGEEVRVPDKLQSPALALDQSEINIGFTAFKMSLDYLKDYFSESRILVVYVPSVIESYAMVSDKVSIATVGAEGGGVIEEIHAAFELAQRSNEIAAGVKAIAESSGVLFVDTRSDIRAAATEQIIHGPIDWNHFNRKGYEVFARSISCGMVKQKILETDACPRS